MCVNPIGIINRRLGEISVPCRTCFDCRKKRGNDLRFLLDKEISACADNAVFLTLTYDNDHLHFVYVSDGLSEFIQLDPRKASLYFGVSEYYNSLLPRERKYIDSDPRLSYCREFSPCFVPSFSDEMKVDIRNWIKRIRVHLSRNRERYNIPSDLPESQFFKYVVVGEYGHTTLRPHWHVVLTSSVLAPQYLESFARDYCVKDWEKRFGHVDYAGKVRSCHAASSYISKYIYKPDSLENPYLVFGAVAPPPSFHSKFMGVSYFDSLRVKFAAVVSKLQPYLSDSSAFDILKFFQVAGGVSNLDDYKAVFEHKIYTDPLFIHLEELFQVLHPRVSDDFTERIPTYYVKSLFPTKPITYKRWSYDNQVFYSETSEGTLSEVDVVFPPGVVSTECRHANVLDVDTPLYSSYCAFVNVRFIYSHYFDLLALRCDLSDLPFDSFQNLVSAFVDLYQSKVVARSFSSERQYISSCTSSRLQFA